MTNDDSSRCAIECRCQLCVALLHVVLVCSISEHQTSLREQSPYSDGCAGQGCSQRGAQDCLGA